MTNRHPFEGTDLDWDDRVICEGRPFTGELVEVDSNNIEIVVQGFKNGIPHGAFRRRYDNGKPALEERYRYGVRLSAMRWYDSGQVAGEWTFDELGRATRKVRWAEDGTVLSQWARSDT